MSRSIDKGGGSDDDDDDDDDDLGNDVQTDDSCLCLMSSYHLGGNR